MLRTASSDWPFGAQDLLETKVSLASKLSNCAFLRKLISPRAIHAILSGHAQDTEIYIYFRNVLGARIDQQQDF